LTHYRASAIMRHMAAGERQTADGTLARVRDVRDVDAGKTKTIDVAARLREQSDAITPFAFRGFLHFLATEVEAEDLVGNGKLQDDLASYISYGDALGFNPCPIVTVQEAFETESETKVRQRQQTFLLSDCNLYYFVPRQADKITPDYPFELRRVESGGTHVLRFDNSDPDSGRWVTMGNQTVTETISLTLIDDARGKLKRSQMPMWKQALGRIARLQPE
jgi:hypothetical protein